MTTLDSKDELGRIANSYWQTRWAGDEEKAKAIWDSLGDAVSAFRERTLTHDGVTLPEDVRGFMAHTRVTTDEEHHCTRWSGHSPFGLWDSDKRLCKVGFRFHEACCNGFRGVWSRPAGEHGLAVVVTYCEGDFSVEVFPEEIDMHAHVGYLNRYYTRSN